MLPYSEIVPDGTVWIEIPSITANISLANLHVDNLIQYFVGAAEPTGGDTLIILNVLTTHTGVAIAYNEKLFIRAPVGASNIVITLADIYRLTTHEDFSKIDALHLVAAAALTAAQKANDKYADIDADIALTNGYANQAEADKDTIIAYLTQLGNVAEADVITNTAAIATNAVNIAAMTTTLSDAIDALVISLSASIAADVSVSLSKINGASYYMSQQ
ncbi:MAG: hypothetical protein COA63_014075 [Methylophaga sp.]|nr:hypothetical protein [Methylophaga sp.]